MWIGEDMFYDTIATARLRIREAVKKTIAFRIFDPMIQVALFLVAKRFPDGDEKLKVACVWLIDMRIVNLIDDAMTECEPEAATSMVRRADPLFCARSPARLDARRAERHRILRQIHL